MTARCEVCSALVEPRLLHLTEAGQWLCRGCHGQYLSQQATQRARRADVFRRCRCGRVMTPMGDPDIKPRNGSDLNLEFLFQPIVYLCSCGERFRADHPAILALYGVTGVFFIAAGVGIDKQDEGIVLVGMGIVFLGYVAHKLVQRARYRRIY